MKKMTALIVSILMAIVAVRYCYLIITEEIKPVLATWSLFSVATGISMWTYMESENKKGLITNIANTTDVCATWFIFICLLIFGKEMEHGFTFFETGCLTSSALILLYWKISNRGNVANIAINAILIIGYFPTIMRLWKSSTNTESFSVWSIVLLSSVIALYNPMKEKDWLALVYASRAVILVCVILGLMIRIETM